MANAERQQDFRGASTTAPSPQVRAIPSDWFLDPADPEAGEKFQEGFNVALTLTLEEQANALLDAHEEAEKEQQLPTALTVEPAAPVTVGNKAKDEHTSLLGSIWSPTEVEGELAWQVDALCAQTDPEAFFPEKGGSTRDAKKVCGACTVRDECLGYALEKDERFGIWGGLSERERRKLRKKAN